jgi:hypothetical protein
MPSWASPSTPEVHKEDKPPVNFALIDTLGTLIVLSTIVAAIAIIFAAYRLLRPGWQFAMRNALILGALIVAFLISLRVFERTQVDCGCG